MAATDPHALYRLVDSDGQLLYIGVTNDPVMRWKQHSPREWWASVASITVEHHPDRRSVLLAERKAILLENPLHNIDRFKNIDGGKTPMHSFRCHDLIWESAKAAADERGETLTSVLQKALNRYVKRNR